jgi:hypothetical protein
VTAEREFEWHERVRGTLDFKIANRDFVLWIAVSARPDAQLDEIALRNDVETWLAQLDADRIAGTRDEPEHTWHARGLLVRFTARPRRPEARGASIPLIANALGASSYRSNLVRSGRVATPWG